MKWTVVNEGPLSFQALETVYRGKTVVMTWDNDLRQYVVTDKESGISIARHRRKLELYKIMKSLPHGDR